MNENGIFGQTLLWITHPSYSNESLQTWFAFLIGILIASFLWKTVVEGLIEA